MANDDPQNGFFYLTFLYSVVTFALIYVVCQKDVQIFESWHVTAICLESSSVRKWFINSFTGILYVVLIGTSQNARIMIIKGVKKVRSTIKLYSYYFSYNVSIDKNVTGIL